MPTLKVLWPVAAVWLLAVCVVGVVLGISSWPAGVTLAVSGIAPMLIAARYWGVPELSLSQSIQRELR